MQFKDLIRWRLYGPLGSIYIALTQTSESWNGLHFMGEDRALSIYHRGKNAKKLMGLGDGKCIYAVGRKRWERKEGDVIWNCTWDPLWNTPPSIALLKFRTWSQTSRILCRPCIAVLIIFHLFYLLFIMAVIFIRKTMFDVVLELHGLVISKYMRISAASVHQQPLYYTGIASTPF